MVGEPGIAVRLFRVLAEHNVSVILISQASSEHTICFAIRTIDVAVAKRVIDKEFRYELQQKFTAIDERPAQTIIAIVGDGMKGTPGVAGKVFQALGRNAVNISAIAQGASERNISFVTDTAERTRAVNIIHQAFFEKTKHLAVILIGVGTIGSALLRQLHQQRAYLKSQGYDVRVCGIANSKRFLVNPNGITIERWEKDLHASPTRMSVRHFIREIIGMQFTNAVLIDCTASSDIVDAYPEFVSANLHIITPNKRANVLPWKRYVSLMELMRSRQKRFLYEANVGAGLPVISTMNDLLASGDRIVKIEGMFSGTLSYLFNEYRSDKSFSTFVRDARQRGYTEPDPREDLSGSDVGRKLLILARQLGMQLDMKNIHVDNLVPRPLRSGPFSNEFFERYRAYDPVIRRRMEKARVEGMVLRYVGAIRQKKVSARLTEVPLNHPFAATRGSDNIIAFTTDRYSHTPLVVQGPGAGADVTAMGVFSDMLKLLHSLPW
jgi:bifunctional aspartokinase / homoserine dehydrogenase 1